MNLTKLKEYTKNVPFSTALGNAKKPRPNVRRKISGKIASSYLGYDPVTGLENATEVSNLELLQEVAELETQTTNMEVAGEALRRKATAIAKQGEIRSGTVIHVLGEAKKLGIAQDNENNAVVKFLNDMALQHTKANNTEALHSLNANTAYVDENTKFTDKVRSLFTAREQKAIDYENARINGEKLKALKQQQAVIAQWQSGNVSTQDALAAYQSLTEKSLVGKASDFLSQTLGL